MNTDSTKVENTTSAPLAANVCYPQFSEKSIVIGCNYHTKWQKYSAMRFVLKEVNGDKARLITRNTGKDFWTNVSDLIFIMSKHNIDKAIRLSA